MKKHLNTIVCSVLLILISLIGMTASADVAPTSINLSSQEIVIDLADTKYATLIASVLPAEAEQDVDWTSSNRNIVRVSSRGKLTARKTGSAIITARSEEDEQVYSTCKVTVIDSDVPTSIILNKTSITIDLAKNSKATLTAAALPEIANQRVRWRTASSSIARVSSSGVVTGRKVGTTVITASSREDSDIYAQCTINVIDSRIPTSIALEGVGASLKLDKYQTMQLTPIVEPASADQTIRWKSSRSSVVSVSRNGLLTAKKAGTATITCYSNRSRNIKAEVQVTVIAYPTPDSISFKEDTTVLVLGETLKLTPEVQPTNQKVCKYFRWKSSSSRRASVSEDGVVTAKRTGWVTITCSSRQSSRVKATRKILVVTEDSPHLIQVKNQDSGIVLNDQTITIHPTETIQLAGTVYPLDKDPNITWKSSRTSRATVDANGLVTAKKTGKVTISAVSKVNKEVKASFELNIVHLPAPDSIKLTAPSTQLEVSETMQLTATTYPIGEKRSQEFKWSTSRSSVARVSSTGLVTPRKTGTVTITVRSVRDSSVRASYTIEVIDSKMPDSVTLDKSGTIEIENGQTLQLNAEVSPATAVQTLRWKSNSSRVTVNQNGVVTGVRSGTATISAISTYDSDKKDTVKIKVVSKDPPVSLTLSSSKKSVMVGKTLRLTPVAVPSDASVLGTYTSSNTSVATVDQNGVVTAHKTGTAVITLKSLKASSVKATTAIVVYDENTPGEITLSDSILFITKGKTAEISGSIYPATAPQTITWSSNNTNVVTVSDSGALKGVGVGTAVVTGSASNGLTASCQINVISNEVATVIPARTTDIAGIAENLSKIADIKQSAKNQIIQLAMDGTITESESTKRQQVIERAFEMQSFPWMTTSTQPYWTNEFAYKKYVPGKVYYGMPYIQKGTNGSYKNREYNVAKALSESRYTSSGKGYYLLNRDNLFNGMYVGNDCSSFMGMSQFGLNHPASFIRTTYLATSAYYKTLSNPTSMRPGDFVVLSGSHTVMFLYWVDDAKTKMMVIEQGGDGSTVICSIHNLAYYTTQGYISRRRADFK